MFFVLYLWRDLCFCLPRKEDWDHVSPVNEKWPDPRVCQAFSELFDLLNRLPNNLKYSRQSMTDAK